MRFSGCLRDGFRVAARHKRLILVLWMTPLLPALVWVFIAAANVVPAFSGSLFADRVLEGDAFVVWMEFRSSPLDALEPLVGRGTVVLALLTLLIQVLVSAGVVEVLLERRTEHPFLLGVRNNALRFARTTVLLCLGTAIAAVAAGAVVRGFFKLAEARADGRFDLAGIVVAAVVFAVIWAPQMLGANLSRIAAARHDHRAMTRGYLRALAAVLRRPGLFGPLALVFIAVPVAAHGVYYLLREPWTPSTSAAVLGLLIAQQGVMVVRASLKLGFRGAEIAAYRALGEPELCRGRSRSRHTAPEIAEPTAAAAGSNSLDSALL